MLLGPGIRQVERIPELESVTSPEYDSVLMEAPAEISKVASSTTPLSSEIEPVPG